MKIKTIIHASLLCNFALAQCMELTTANNQLITDTSLQKLITQLNKSSHITTIVKEHAQQKNIPLMPQNMRTLFPSLQQEEINDMFLENVKDDELRRLLLSMGADIKARTEKKHNCLWHINNPKLIQELIEGGAEIDIIDQHNDTPITNFIYYANTPEDFAAADILFTHSTNPKMHFTTGKDILNHTIKYRNSDQTLCLKTVQLLCKHGIDVNAPDSIGYTPLINAIQEGLTDIVEYLLQNGADANTPNKYEEYPIHQAMENDSYVYAHNAKKIIPKIVILLLQHKADPNKPYKYAQNARPLHVAVGRNQPEIIKELIQHGAEKHHMDDSRRTAYELAQRRGYKQEILDLLYVEKKELEPIQQKQPDNSASINPNKILEFSMSDFQEPKPQNNGYCSVQ